MQSDFICALRVSSLGNSPSANSTVDSTSLSRGSLQSTNSGGTEKSNSPASVNTSLMQVLSKTPSNQVADLAGGSAVVTDKVAWGGVVVGATVLVVSAVVVVAKSEEPEHDASNIAVTVTIRINRDMVILRLNRVDARRGRGVLVPRACVGAFK